MAFTEVPWTHRTSACTEVCRWCPLLLNTELLERWSPTSAAPLPETEASWWRRPAARPAWPPSGPPQPWADWGQAAGLEGKKKEPIKNLKLQITIKPIDFYPQGAPRSHPQKTLWAAAAWVSSECWRAAGSWPKLCCWQERLNTSKQPSLKEELQGSKGGQWWRRSILEGGAKERPFSWCQGPTVRSDSLTPGKINRHWGMWWISSYS